MIKLQRIGHILFSVRDLERSKEFYTKVLGFTLLDQDPDHGGAFLSLGEYGNTLDLFQSTNPDAYPLSREPRSA
jgi:catechol 2,3-dioxygenase-like lactoylglutathione lyase family enzyme